MPAAIWGGWIWAGEVPPPPTERGGVANMGAAPTQGAPAPPRPDWVPSPSVVVTEPTPDPSPTATADEPSEPPVEPSPTPSSPAPTTSAAPEVTAEPTTTPGATASPVPSPTPNRP
ncbi:hypothetical protein [Polymorphospora rubra]|uniref:hypothetical protein n=1 Tax=Polymorphospora rubra TaxID=338584 RepID=UPI001BB42B37|nr:hypothetical protein [Polymorphospora rubra]